MKVTLERFAREGKSAMKSQQLEIEKLAIYAQLMARWRKWKARKTKQGKL